MKKLKVLLWILLLAVIMGGCYDNREIDETAYIIALGIDKDESGGYVYTYQFSAPSPEGGGGGEEEKESGSNTAVKNIVVLAPDFYSAKNMTNNFLSKNTDMSHLKLIVFSQEVDSEILSAHSEFLLREREIRPHTAVALAKSSAKEYLGKIKPELETNTAKYYELLALNSNNIYAPTKTLSDFVDELSGEAAASVLPLVRNGKSNDASQSEVKDASMWLATDAVKLDSKQPDLKGMAVFSEGVLSGTMDGDSGLLYNLLTGKIQHCTIALKNPYSDTGSLPFSVSVPNSARYSVEERKDFCKIAVSQALSVEYSGARLPDGFENYQELYSFAEKTFEEQFRLFFYDISRIKKADIMNIAAYFKKQFVTQREWESKNWQKLYQNAEFDIDIYFI